MLNSILVVRPEVIVLIISMLKMGADGMLSANFLLNHLKLLSFKKLLQNELELNCLRKSSPVVWKVALIYFGKKTHSLLGGFFDLPFALRSDLDNIGNEAQLDIKLLQDGFLKFDDQTLLVAPFDHVWILQLKINLEIVVCVRHDHIVVLSCFKFAQVQRLLHYFLKVGVLFSELFYLFL